jgi:hypothetical protein
MDKKKAPAKFYVRNSPYSSNPALWFWWGCAGCASPAPKLVEHNRFFRHLNPAPGKSNPKAFARYMRGAVKRSKYYFTAPTPYKSRLGNLQRVLLLGWHAKKLCCWGFWGLLAHSLARSPPQAVVFHSLLNWPLASVSWLLALFPWLRLAKVGNPFTGAVEAMASLLYWCR